MEVIKAIRQSFVGQRSSLHDYTVPFVQVFEGQAFRSKIQPVGFPLKSENLFKFTGKVEALHRVVQTPTNNEKKE